MKYLIILLSLTALPMMAANTLTGTVKDSNSEPIPGANLVWLNSSRGASTDMNGEFTLERPANADKLIVSFIGYNTDTISIASYQEYIDIVLNEGVQLAEVNVTGRKMGFQKLRSSVTNAELINSDELCRAACCNLGAIRMRLQVQSRSSFWDFREHTFRCLQRIFLTSEVLLRLTDWDMFRDRG